MEEVIAIDATNEIDSVDIMMNHLQELLLGDEFFETKKHFMEANCHIFTDDEENKLEYTPIYNSYVTLLETFIERKLKAIDKSFDMTQFLSVLHQKQKFPLLDDVHEVLDSLADFNCFKESMLHFKKRDCSKDQLEGLLTITSIK